MSAIQTDTLFILGTEIMNSETEEPTYSSSSSVKENATIADIFSDVKPIMESLMDMESQMDANNSASFKCDFDYRNLNLNLTDLEEIIPEEYEEFIANFTNNELPTDLSAYGIAINKLKAKIDLTAEQAEEQIEDSEVVTEGNFDLKPSTFALNATFEPNTFIDLTNSRVEAKYASSIINKIEFDTNNDCELSFAVSNLDSTPVYSGNGSLSSDNFIEIELADSYEYDGSIKIIVNCDYSEDDLSWIGGFVDETDSLDEEEPDPSAIVNMLNYYLSEGLSYEISIKAYSTNNVETYSKTFTSVEEFLVFMVGTPN